MIFQHHRFAIWNINQHPYKHRASEFGYTNAAFGGTVLTVKGALDWIIKVLYPNQKAAVATVADLPMTGNTLNDYRVVLDDGDGNQAGYRWEQREGDANAQWYKIYDFDWSTDSILASFQNLTQDMYVHKRGRDDVDAAGDFLTGDLAGQSIYGGASANTHLTLYANAGDGVGPQTGFVQFGDNVRPLEDSIWTLGTDSYRWADFFTDAAKIATMSISSGSIIDSTGEIDFGGSDLTTLGDIITGTLSLSSGYIVDTSGEIDFIGTDLSGIGSITGESITALTSPSALFSGTTIGSITIANGSIYDVLGEIDFNGNDLVGIESLEAEDIFADEVLVGGVGISSSAIYADEVDSDLDISANGIGAVNILSHMHTLDQDILGSVSIDGDLKVDNLYFDGNTITSTDEDGNIILSPHGAGLLSSSASILPTIDDTLSLGGETHRWEDLYLSGAIHDGTLALPVGTLMSLRDINDGVTDGMTIFWDAALGKWVPSIPDDEIVHGDIAGLDQDDHLQYALLEGRQGGQTFIGGNGSGDNLVLGSTAHETKGSVIIQDTVLPGTDAALDLGFSGTRWRDLYMSGQGIGFRAQNIADTASLPAASAFNAGRLTYVAGGQDLFVDVGGSWKQVSMDTVFIEDDENWDGSTLEHTYDVSSDVTNARRLLWQFCDNSDDHAVIVGARITKPTATTVKVEFEIPPTAGTYTLVGVGR